MQNLVGECWKNCRASTARICAKVAQQLFVTCALGPMLAILWFIVLSLLFHVWCQITGPPKYEILKMQLTKYLTKFLTQIYGWNQINVTNSPDTASFCLDLPA